MNPAAEAAAAAPAKVGALELAIQRCQPSQLKPMYKDAATLGFGEIFTDHIFTMKYKDGKWGEARIEPYHSFTLDPATLVFHYGQEIFEGLKAFAGADGSIRLFRADRNIARMNRSAQRMSMPAIPADAFMDAIVEMVRIDKKWIPRNKGTALYIRPTMLATQFGLGVKTSNSYLFYIILSPVGPYFKEGFNPVPLYVCADFVRAVKGGCGEAKTGANYAASLVAAEAAKKKGCSQVLWLDAIEHKFIEEVGSMNIFFAFNNKKLVTPALSGSILHGVTRESVIALSRKLGYECEERPITIDEVVDGIKSGALAEAFGAGTAAVIAPVGKLVMSTGEMYEVNKNTLGPISKQLFDTLTAIQNGSDEDTFGWVKTIGAL